MAERTIAIGDIHGCSTALAALLEAIGVEPSDTIIPLGDFVDRGDDSKGVLDQLIELAGRCRLIPIWGNHEEMMLRACDGPSHLRIWLECGGQATLDSYENSGQIDVVPKRHVQFLESCIPYHATDTHLFVHANYRPEVPLDRLDGGTLRWLSLRDYVPPKPHCSRKTAVVGHTPQREILDLGYLVCIDTGCCKGGWLTALDVENGRVWQTNEKGTLREP